MSELDKVIAEMRACSLRPGQSQLDVWADRLSATRESAGGEASLDTLRLNWLDANPQLVLRSGKQHIRPLIDAAMHYDGIRNSLKEEDNGA